ncbi:MAG: hypothetical protein HPPSJP_3730 [Candidatus Hepatoplasma scabrum]|nr:MAG: hypothetical protein HPPSJP_3730 [Candidatus Hepatoplasma sp.]
MKNKDIILTLIITIYNPQYYEIKNWLNFKNKLKEYNDIQFLFLIDNPEINENILNLIKKEKAEYKMYEKNHGKFYIVKDACDKNIARGLFIKICDPDDLIITEHLLNFANWLKKLKSYRDYLILTSHGIIKTGYHAEENINMKKIQLKTFGGAPINCNTVFSRAIIKRFKNKYDKLSKSSDSLISVNTLLDPKTIYIVADQSKWFYIYNWRKGISSYNLFDYNKKKLKLKYKNLFLDNYRYLNILKNMQKEINNIKYVNFPTKYDFITVNNSLIKGKFSWFARICYITKIYKIFQKINISENDWNLFILFKCYFFQTFKIKRK